MAKEQPDLSAAWNRINARIKQDQDIEATRLASRPSPLASFGDVRGNVINIGSINRVDLERVLSAIRSPND